MAAIHTVRLMPEGRRIDAPEDLPVLAAAHRAGLALPYSCRAGRCGSCRARLLEGRIEYAAGAPPGLSEPERAQGYVLLCQAFARSDLVLEARPVQRAPAVEIRTVTARLARRVRLSPDVMQLMLRVPATESLEFLPGQHLDVLLEGGARRSYSVANAAQAGSHLELHVGYIEGGAFSEAVFGSLKEGAPLRIEGPLGCFLHQGGAGPQLFIAGGTGFAPIKAMLTQELAGESSSPVHLYWGARESAGIYEPALLRDWAARHARLSIHTVLSATAPGAARRTGLVHQAVLEDHPDLAAFSIYAAGPPGLIDAIRSDFPARGADPERVFVDAFDSAAPP